MSNLTKALSASLDETDTLRARVAELEGFAREVQSFYRQRQKDRSDNRFFISAKSNWDRLNMAADKALSSPGSGEYVVVKRDLFDEMAQWTLGAIDDPGHKISRRIAELQTRENK